MAEYIEREAVLNKQIGVVVYDEGGWDANVRAVPVEDIEAIPAADVTPVVRCKECKHWHEELGWCDKHSHFVDADGEFCHPWESAEWKMFAGDYFCKDGDLKGGEG